MTRRVAAFDFDGTVADSAAWFYGAVNEVARLHGFREVSADERETLRRCSARQILKRLQVPLWKVPAIARTMRRIAARDLEVGVVQAHLLAGRVAVSRRK